MPERRQLTRSRAEQTEPIEPAPTSASESTTEPTGTDATLEIGDASATVSGDPTAAEAAILAAVVTEQLQTEAAAAEPEEPHDAVDPWSLAARFGVRSPRRVPNTCAAGREWKVAGRAATW